MVSAFLVQKVKDSLQRKKKDCHDHSTVLLLDFVKRGSPVNQIHSFWMLFCFQILERQEPEKDYEKVILIVVNVETES